MERRISGDSGWCVFKERSDFVVIHLATLFVYDAFWLSNIKDVMYLLIFTEGSLC